MALTYSDEKTTCERCRTIIAAPARKPPDAKRNRESADAGRIARTQLAEKYPDEYRRFYEAALAALREQR